MVCRKNGDIFRFRLAKSGDVPIFLVIVFAVLLWPSTAFAKETPIPASPTRWVTDTANFMSPGAAASLNSRLESYANSSGHQLIVYIGQTTGDTPIEDWAARAFQQWKVGRKGIDDGLVLFIMAADHRLRFEVGYGLEAIVPDTLAGRVINEVIVPRIRAGDPDGGVTAGMDAVMMVIGGGSLPPARQAPRGQQQRPLTLGQLILYGIIGLIILIVLVTHPGLAMYLLFSILSGGRDGGDSGGGSGGGGGFSGGGGRSGGGGASGSW